MGQIDAQYVHFNNNLTQGFMSIDLPCEQFPFGKYPETAKLDTYDAEADIRATVGAN